MNRNRLVALGAAASMAAAAGAQDIIVALDMDASLPGIQQSITVPPGTTSVEGVAVYFWDTTGQHLVSGLGCFQCSARMSMAMGHYRGNGRIIGQVDSLDPALGEPVIQGHDHFATTQGFFNPFNGPTIEYYANTQFVVNSGLLQSAPTRPQFTAKVNLTSATAGDVYRFYLIDIQALVGGGAFSVAQPFSFEAGGDAVPDMTPTTQGVDLDRALASPPAPFLVDYRDGPVTGGGATIVIDGCYADCDQSTGVGMLDIFDFLCFQSAFVNGEPFACECDTSTGARQCDILDFLCFQDAFVSGCR